MDIQAEKIELIKRLLNTNNVHIVQAIKSVFGSYDSEEWANLPDEVIISDIKESLRQIENGQGISFNEARETYKK